MAEHPNSVRPTGALFAKDHEGYLIPRGSIERVPASVLPAVRAVVDLYTARFGRELVAVYIRGSAVCGGFVPGSSDSITPPRKRGFAARLRGP